MHSRLRRWEEVLFAFIVERDGQIYHLSREHLSFFYVYLLKYVKGGRYLDHSRQTHVELSTIEVITL